MWRLPAVLAAALVCSLADAHQTFLAHRYQRQHASLPDVTVKHERLRTKLLLLNQTAVVPVSLHSHLRTHNRTEPAEASPDMLDGLLNIMQHVLDPFYDFLKAVAESAQEPPQTVRAGPPGRKSIPNLLY